MIPVTILKDNGTTWDLINSGIGEAKIKLTITSHHIILFGNWMIHLINLIENLVKQRLIGFI